MHPPEATLALAYLASQRKLIAKVMEVLAHPSPTMERSSRRRQAPMPLILGCRTVDSTAPPRDRRCADTAR